MKIKIIKVQYFFFGQTLKVQYCLHYKCHIFGRDTLFYNSYTANLCIINNYNIYKCFIQKFYVFLDP